MVEHMPDPERIEDTREALDRVERQDDGARLEFLEKLHDRLESELEGRPSQESETES
ncbi:MAG: hypothetical protein M3285_06280 [Actinomycetota bacterium]|nr:hypothetical protein [Actinomycetota bacterium]